MRVAIITRRFFRAGGGAEGYAVALARELSRQHEVHVFSQQTDQPVPGLSYHPLAFVSERPRWLNQWVFAISSWWQTRRGFDVVHSHENTWHGQVQTIHVRPLRFNLLHGLSGGRLIWRWLKIVTSPRLLTYVYLEAARFKSRAGRTVVAASSLLRDDCVSAYPRSRIDVVPPGVDMPSHTRTKTQAREALDLNQSGRWLLFVANDYARKGLGTLLEAMVPLAEEVQLAVVGDTKQRTQFEASARELGLANRVQFLGSLQDVSLAYQAADALVHPTLEDSYAMVVVEAMAHRLPVIVSGYPWCGVAAQLIHDQHALLLASPQDAYALTTHIRRLLHDTDLQQRLIQTGEAFARAHDWAAASLEYERFYEHARVHASWRL